MDIPRTLGRRHHRLLGFTLMELLAAMALLSFIVLILAQIVTGAAGSTKHSRKRIDADNEARRVFDRISADLTAMLNRPDVDFLIRKTTGNDEFYFFAEAPARLSGSGSSQPVSLVGYRVNGSQQVERLSQGLSWDAVPPNGPVFLTFSGSTLESASTIAGAYGSILSDAAKYHVLGDGVFRMEVDFLLKSESGVPAKISTSPFRAGGASPYSNKGKGMADVQAIVVTLVVLDSTSRTIVGEMDNLAAKFADSIEGTAPASSWEAVVGDPASLGIPAGAAANVRVYQRIFPLSSILPISS